MENLQRYSRVFRDQVESPLTISFVPSIFNILAKNLLITSVGRCNVSNSSKYIFSVYTWVVKYSKFLWHITLGDGLLLSEEDEDEEDGDEGDDVDDKNDNESLSLLISSRLSWWWRW